MDIVWIILVSAMLIIAILSLIEAVKARKRTKVIIADMKRITDEIRNINES